MTFNEQLAKEVHDLAIDCAVMHFEDKHRLVNPAYVVEYLKSLKEIPLNISNLKCLKGEQK